VSGGRHRRRPEDAIQRAVFQHLRARAERGVFAFHPANGGYRKPVEAAIMKGLGVVAGVPDVIVIHEGRCYALEIKAPGGRATPKQLATSPRWKRPVLIPALPKISTALSKCSNAGESCGGERHEEHLHRTDVLHLRWPRMSRLCPLARTRGL
jgi:hypothetical protein